jgi:hypothetical protein
MTVKTIRFEGELPEGWVIAGTTNPWIEEADSDTALDLEQVALSIGQLNNSGQCYGCYNCILEGVIEAMDTPEGIQRCDNCDVFEGDLEAAQALADALTEFGNGAVKHYVYVEIEERRHGNPETVG